VGDPVGRGWRGVTARNQSEWGAMGGAAEVTVRPFAFLKDVFGQGEIAVPLSGGRDVAQVLSSICTSERQQRALFDTDGVIRGDVIVLVNGIHVQHLGGPRTIVSGGDVISVFPPIYGG
jgi:sulfur-carrier protein